MSNLDPTIKLNLEDTSVPERLVGAEGFDDICLIKAPEGWFLCNSSEGYLVESFNAGTVVVVNDTFVVKPIGKFSALCLKDVHNNQGELLFRRGHWYSPVEETREYLRDVMDLSDANANPDQGKTRVHMQTSKWSYMRPADTRNIGSLSSRISFATVQGLLEYVEESLKALPAYLPTHVELEGELLALSEFLTKKRELMRGEFMIDVNHFAQIYSGIVGEQDSAANQRAVMTAFRSILDNPNNLSENPMTTESLLQLLGEVKNLKKNQLIEDYIVLDNNFITEPKIDIIREAKNIGAIFDGTSEINLKNKIRLEP